jgi:hypothetical protein
MTIANIPGADQRVVMRGRVRMTAKYTIEISLYDFGGVYANEVLWAPYRPSPARQKMLASKIDAALAPYFAKAFQLGGLLEREAS